MPMNPRLLRPIASRALPLAEARDSSDNVIAATDYIDGEGVKWRAHIFSESGTLTFTRGGPVEYLVVAGGGGGGRASSNVNISGGGGGAGGLLTNLGGAPLFVSPGPHSISVGAGGAGATGSPHVGGDGSNSSFGSLVVALGGGGGGEGGVGLTTQNNGRPGGSGGGAGGSTSDGGLGGTGTAGQGNNGGARVVGTTLRQNGAGGGGAGGVGGQQTVSGSAPATGGAGLSNSISGLSQTYAKGGAAQPQFNATDPGDSGAANSGEGGEGVRGTATSTGGNGGSGVVIVRYRRPNVLNVDDPDVANYLAAVQAADGQTLEPAVRSAIADFIVGCKADGIWDSIKASCILAGARTLAGALVPLRGAAPTNNNFVAGDYNRLTGLKGDGSTKYLDSNRNNNDDPQDSVHHALWVAAAATINSVPIGAGFNLTGSTRLATNYTSSQTVARIRQAAAMLTINAVPLDGSFFGYRRSASDAWLARINGSDYTDSDSSETPFDGDVFVFADNNNGSLAGYSDARLAFYSIGESLDLEALDTRVSALITAIGNS